MFIMFWIREGSMPPPIMLDIIEGSIPMDLVSEPISTSFILDRSICCTRSITSVNRVSILSSPCCILSENSCARLSMPDMSSLGVLLSAVASMTRVER
ncbi:hypothetical protein FR483_n495L [Paramecium bursaria Chlorella virus FR483]|uniref:Uncharacterized protein n495L n=1 Tax=Paramecium bursaria Chlorella virus FR483 TaxID=399781 RepID=A7J7J9_PBCVF|nr:hypothetical protein FR483_n495L [Paramecium bursaria Chlorella virus FR483]ABT15780.1 hypothetical protein FR483_n495L [Paramecium bursaria Chlorella virus FR483]